MTMENEVRLINANKILEFADAMEKKYRNTRYLRMKTLRYIVSKIPTIDAVEVIRCHECQSHTEDPETGKFYCRKPLGCMGCIEVKPDDFCSRGEKGEPKNVRNRENCI